MGVFGLLLDLFIIFVLLIASIWTLVKLYRLEGRLAELERRLLREEREGPVRPAAQVSAAQHPDPKAFRKAEEAGLVFSGDKRTLLECADRRIGKAVIPVGVTDIADGVFEGCENLTCVTIPDSVLRIGENAFSGCTRLTSVTIPGNVAEINWFAFSYCTRLASVEISAGVAVIGSGAFFDCAALARVDIPDSVAEIHGCAFCGCTGLSCVTIPGSVAMIGEGAFFGVGRVISENTRFPVDGSGVLFDVEKKKLLYVPPSFAGNYSIPDSVTRIGNRAFCRCGDLTGVVIPDGITEIGEWAFSHCTGLTDVTISGSVTKIGWGAFDGCTNLARVIIPPSVTEIVSHAFNGCTNLAYVTIPAGVTEIGESAFSGVGRVESDSAKFTVDEFGALIDTEHKRLLYVPPRLAGHYSIPERVVEIGGGAFYGCTRLTRVTVPDGVVKIPWNEFSGTGCEAQVKRDYPRLFS